MLTQQQEHFCEEYLSNGYCILKAYRVAYPESSEESSRKNAYRVMKNEEVREYINQANKERFDALHITAERVAEEIAKLAFSDFDDNNTANSKLKALELLGKQLGLYTQKVELDNKTTISITIDQEEEANAAN